MNWNGLFRDRGRGSCARWKYKSVSRGLGALGVIGDSDSASSNSNEWVDSPKE